MSVSSHRGTAHMQQSPYGASPQSNRPDASLFPSGTQTPSEGSARRRNARATPGAHWAREGSESNIDAREAFRSPGRNASEQFEHQPRTSRILPTVALDGNANPNLMMPTPHQPYPRTLSDGSFNNGAAESLSQSGAETPTADNLSQVSTSVSTNGNLPGNRKIIYRLALNDYKEGPINGTTFRYSFEPFRGLNRSDDPLRHKLAVMDLSSNVLGYWPHGGRRRRNQLRDSFWQDEDSAPFVVGVDFISRSHTFYSIRIHSKQVLDCLRDAIKYYPDLGLSFDQSEVSFEYPYRALVHYYDKLQEYRNNCPASYTEAPESTNLLNPTTKEHLDVVMGHLEIIYQNDIQPELDMHSTKGLAKFDTLWLLYKPGDTVFARIKGQLMFFKVLSVNREIDKAGDPTGPWSIIVWGLYFDGYILTRQARRFKIPEYHGPREIQKLPIKPISYLLPSDGKPAEHIKRGKQYYDFICEAPLYRRYDGPVNGNGGEQYIGDVIVDPTAYIKEHAKSKVLPGEFEVMFGASNQREIGEVVLGEVMLGDPPDFGGGPYSRLNDRKCTKDTPLEEKEDWLLLPGFIQGYALRGKAWMAFDLHSFLKWDNNETPWKSLVIDDREMDLLESLAHSDKDHKGTELAPWTSDFIAGKGQGQCVLLHGPPGVGKTTTVECIATQMKRPLLTLTVADIGTKETEAESNLTKWLGLATKWGAIVLIDEAETFLTRRGQGEMGRNAIVAAFLRTLEYHQGMIFLTTNDIGKIDEAVVSRIHLAIQYKPLKAKDRKKIWKNLMNRLEIEQKRLPASVPRIEILSGVHSFVGREMDIDPSQLDRLVVSGRDIRNAFQTAVRLARHEASKEEKAARNGGERGGRKGKASGKDDSDESGEEPEVEEGVPKIQLTEDQLKRAFVSKLELKDGIAGITGQSLSAKAREAEMRNDTWEGKEW